MFWLAVHIPAFAVVCLFAPRDAASIGNKPFAVHRHHSAGPYSNDNTGKTIIRMLRKGPALGSPDGQRLLSINPQIVDAGVMEFGIVSRFFEPPSGKLVRAIPKRFIPKKPLFLAFALGKVAAETRSGFFWSCLSLRPARLNFISHQNALCLHYSLVFSAAAFKDCASSGNANLR